MHQGSCLCGAVAYELDAAIEHVVCCHCRECRKAQGTAFGANVPVPADKLRFIRGGDALKTYAASPGKRRVFCGVCGSPIFSRRDDSPDVVRLRIGTLDTRIDVTPAAHAWVSDKAEWYAIRDPAPQYPEFEP